MPNVMKMILLALAVVGAAELLWILWEGVCWFIDRKLERCDECHRVGFKRRGYSWQRQLNVLEHGTNYEMCWVCSRCKDVALFREAVR